MADTIQAITGFTVAGYVGENPTPESARVVPVLATDEVQALVMAAKAYPGFTPVGAMSKAEHERHLKLIADLEASQAYA